MLLYGINSQSASATDLGRLGVQCTSHRSSYMSFTKFALAAIAASLLSASALADNAPPATPPAMGAGHGMMRGLLTPEERMMLFADMFKATAGMTDDQKQAYRQQQRTRLVSMSDPDRAKFKADLDARWNALPADQKSAMMAKLKAFMAARQSDRATQ